MSADFYTQLRTLAINKITEGKNQFMNGTTYEAKFRGYELFKQGVLDLKSYANQEPNPQIKSIAIENVSKYITELENNKKYLDQHAPQIAQIQQSNNQQKIQQQQPQKIDQSVASQKLDQTQQGQGQQKPQEDVNVTKMKENLSTAIVKEKPNVFWDDVAGLYQAKEALKEAVITPIKFPDWFEGVRTPWMGILLYGPPGTGKTFLAKACATECDGTFFSVSSSDLISKFVGDSERLIKELFGMAREKKPSIIFIDEVDSMCGARDQAGGSEASARVKTEFLVQMQGVGNNNNQVLVLGATNLPWTLDQAIRRRFEKRVYIPLPDLNGRLALITNKLKNTPNVLTQQEMMDLAEQLEGYSGADLTTLIREAAFEPIRKSQRATHFKQIMSKGVQKWIACSPSDPQGVQRGLNSFQRGEVELAPIEYDDFLTVRSVCKPTVAQADLKKYEEWTKEFGQDG